LEAIMYRRIAVALDPGPESRKALRWALAIARKADCPLDLIRVAIPPVHGADLYAAAVLSDADTKRLEDAARQELRDLADDAATSGVRATPVVLRGDIPSALSDHLRESEADLVVLATHDRGRLERLLLGSVSEAVMRHAHVPALLIRARPTDQAGDVVDIEPGVQRILLPIDGSPFAEQILAPAATLATLMGASLTLLSVVEPVLANAALVMGIDGTLIPPLGSRPSDSDADEKRLALERLTLERTVERLKALGLSVSAEVIIDARAAHTIVEFASRHRVDLIAMTTHGRGALKRLVAGSVAESVLHAASAHMLLYRPENPAPS
jgi:nucleotide-binding universal stress UspA family protein